MIQWVNEACKSWGRAQYWLLYGNKGLPSRTILGKLIEEGLVGAACNQWTKDYPEVLQGQNLIVANAVKQLPEQPRTLITIHYVISGTARYKCRVISMPIRTYYGQIDHAHFELAQLIEDADSAHNRARVCRTNPIPNAIFDPNMSVVSA
jgi:hypothetical protein